MQLGHVVDTAQRRLYADPVKRLVHRFGLEDAAKRAYWTAVSPHVDPRTVEVEGVSASLRAGSMAEYETVESAVVAERPLLADLLSRLQPGDTVYDVGAHVGTYACLAAGALPDGEVVAFEPYPPNAARVRENAELNGFDVTVREVALADERRTTDLAVHRDGGVGTQEHSIHPGYRNPDHMEGSITVETVPGDDLIADGLPAPTVVKVDVEGAGPAALDGMADALRRPDCRLVYCEPHDNADALRDRLEALGFAVEPVYLSGHRRGEPASLRASRE